MKVVINGCFGGFSLSRAAEKLLKERGVDLDYYRDINRADPELVKVVEELGDKANGPCAELRIVEIPDDVKWHVHEYDGAEHVAENHRTWG